MNSFNPNPFFNLDLNQNLLNNYPPAAPTDGMDPSNSNTNAVIADESPTTNVPAPAAAVPPPFLLPANIAQGVASFNKNSSSNVNKTRWTAQQLEHFCQKLVMCTNSNTECFNRVCYLFWRTPNGQNDVKKLFSGDIDVTVPSEALESSKSLHNFLENNPNTRDYLFLRPYLIPRRLENSTAYWKIYELMDGCKDYKIFRKELFSVRCWIELNLYRMDESGFEEIIKGLNKSFIGRAGSLLCFYLKLFAFDDKEAANESKEHCYTYFNRFRALTLILSYPFLLEMYARDLFALYLNKADHSWTAAELEGFCRLLFQFIGKYEIKDALEKVKSSSSENECIKAEEELWKSFSLNENDSLNDIQKLLKAVPELKTIIKKIYNGELRVSLSQHSSIDEYPHVRELNFIRNCFHRCGHKDRGDWTFFFQKYYEESFSYIIKEIQKGYNETFIKSGLYYKFQIGKLKSRTIDSKLFIAMPREFLYTESLFLLSLWAFQKHAYTQYQYVNNNSNKPDPITQEFYELTRFSLPHFSAQPQQPHLTMRPSSGQPFSQRLHSTLQPQQRQQIFNQTNNAPEQEKTWDFDQLYAEYEKRGGDLPDNGGASLNEPFNLDTLSSLLGLTQSETSISTISTETQPSGASALDLAVDDVDITMASPEVTLESPQRQPSSPVLEEAMSPVPSDSLSTTQEAFTAPPSIKEWLRTAPRDVATVSTALYTFYDSYRSLCKDPHGNDLLHNALLSSGDKGAEGISTASSSSSKEATQQCRWGLPAAPAVVQSLITAYRSCVSQSPSSRDIIVAAFLYHCREGIALHLPSHDAVDAVINDSSFPLSDYEKGLLRSAITLRLPPGAEVSTAANDSLATAMEQLANNAMKWRADNVARWAVDGEKLLEGRKQLDAFLFKNIAEKKGGEFTPCLVTFNAEGSPQSCETVPAGPSRKKLKQLAGDRIRLKEGSFCLMNDKFKKFCSHLRDKGLSYPDGTPFLLLQSKGWHKPAAATEKEAASSPGEYQAAEKFLLNFSSAAHTALNKVVEKSYSQALSRNGINATSHKDEVLKRVECHVKASAERIDTPLSRKLREKIQDNSSKPPAPFNAILSQLKPYQIEAVQNALRWQEAGSLLFHDTGLGKTIVIQETILQMIAQAVKDPSRARHALVVGTASTYLQTRDKFIEYLGPLKDDPTLPPKLRWINNVRIIDLEFDVKGSLKLPQNISPQDLESSYCIFIVKPGDLKEPAKRAAIASYGIAAVAVDEAHELRNDKGCGFSNIKNLVQECATASPNKNNPHLLLATATPFSNRIQDLFSLVILLDSCLSDSLPQPEKAKNLEKTRELYLAITHALSRQLYSMAEQLQKRSAVKATDATANPAEQEVERAALYHKVMESFYFLESFKQLLKPLMSRYLKSDKEVRQQWDNKIPIEQVKTFRFSLEGNSAQQKAFDKLESEYSKKVSNQSNFLKFHWAHGRIAVHPSFAEMKRDAIIEKIKALALSDIANLQTFVDESPLLKLLVHPSVKHQAKKGIVIVVDQVSMGLLVEQIAKRILGVGDVTFLSGETKVEERRRIIANFEDEKTLDQEKILILMKKACVGIDCPNNGHTLIMTSRDMNPAVDLQAVNRVVRARSPKTEVEIWNAVYGTPHEQRIDYILTGKKNLEKLLLENHANVEEEFLLFLDHLERSEDFKQYQNRAAAYFDEIKRDLLQRARQNGALTPRALNRYSILHRKIKKSSSAPQVPALATVAPVNLLAPRMPMPSAASKRTIEALQPSENSSSSKKARISSSTSPSTSLRWISDEGRSFSRIPLRQSDQPNGSNLLRALVSGSELYNRCVNDSSYQKKFEQLTPELAEKAATSTTELNKNNPSLHQWLCVEIQGNVTVAQKTYNNDASKLSGALADKGFNFIVWDDQSKQQIVDALRLSITARATVHLLKSQRKLPNGSVVTHYDLLHPESEK